jgi:predicted RNA methylase
METTSQAGTRYVAYFTKGLADVVASEIRTLVPGATLGETADRFAVIAADGAGLARLRSQGRTFDDIRLLVAGPATIEDAASFDRLCAQAAAATRAYLDENDAARADVAPWSVTMSARTPSWRRTPGWDPAGPVTARLGGADLQARTRSAVDLRIQVDGEQAHISVNLTGRPHGQRSGGPVRPGALRPSVAASLVRLALDAADPATARRGLYDPCCGTGTIAAEAVRLSLPVYASDIDAEAVSITTQRLADLGGLGGRGGLAEPGRAGTPRVRVFRRDVLTGVPRDVAARVVASNLPWGKQVRLASHRELFDAIAALTAQAVADGGASALLTTSPEQLVARIRRRAPTARITTRRIGLLGQTPTVVVAQPG